MAFPSPGDRAAIEADPNLQLRRAGGLQHRLSRAEHVEAAVRRRARAARHQHGDRQGGDHRGGLPGRRRRREEPDPADASAYNDDIEDYPYDPAAAQQLMIEAGLAEGFDTDLWYIPVSRPYNPNGKRVAEMIQYRPRQDRHPRHAGDRRMERLPRRSCRTARRRWRSTAGPATTAIPTISSTCCSAARRRGSAATTSRSWCNRDYDKLVNDAKLITDRGRARRSSTARRRSSSTRTRRGCRSPIRWCSWRRAPNVTGFKMDPLGRHAFEGVDLKE